MDTVTMHAPATAATAGYEALSEPLRQLEKRIRAHRAVVGVVGQGYVGFPLAQRVAEVGFPTIGFDISGATVARCEKENRFATYKAVRSAIHLSPCDVIIIAVPTPTKEEGGRREPDLSLVIGAVQTVLLNLPDDGRARLLLLESTYASGTTRNVIAPLVAAKHDLGVMVALGYSPERIDPGNQTFSLVNTPKVTSGYDAGSAWLTQFFYAQVVERAVPASSLEAAEATKILENTFRFINITFAQEFDEYCEKMGLNAREITTLAGTKPFGFMPFFAGPGIGGHCIAEDPYYLYESMRLSGMEPKILEAAIANHERRAAVIVERVVRRLGGRPIHGARILLLGVSYKPNIGDPRQSPAAPILRQLESEGAVVDYHDSHVPRFAGRASVDLAAVAAEDYDLAVLITEHADIDQAALLKDGWRIVDTRNATRSHGAERPQRRFAERIGEVVRLLKPRPVAGVR